MLALPGAERGAQSWPLIPDPHVPGIAKTAIDSTCFVSQSSCDFAVQSVCCFRFLVSSLARMSVISLATGLEHEYPVDSARL